MAQHDYCDSPGLEAGPPTAAEWEAARARFRKIQRTYEDLLDTHGMDLSYATTLIFLPLSMRYFGGERSRGLYDEMMAVRE